MQELSNNLFFVLTVEIQDSQITQKSWLILIKCKQKVNVLILREIENANKMYSIITYTAIVLVYSQPSVQNEERLLISLQVGNLQT